MRRITSLRYGATSKVGGGGGVATPGRSGAASGGGDVDGFVVIEPVDDLIGGALPVGHASAAAGSAVSIGAAEHDDGEGGGGGMIMQALSVADAVRRGVRG